MEAETQRGLIPGRLRVIAIAVVALTITATMGSVAWAHYFGPYYADNSEQTYYIYSESSWTTTQKSAITYAMSTVLDDSTDMSDTKQSASDSQTDVKFMRGSYTNPPYSTYFAWVECNNAQSASVCNSFNLKLNTSKPHSNYKALFCHEVGHTAGLEHWPGNNANAADADNSCMRGSPDLTTWNSDQRSHINDRY